MLPELRSSILDICHSEGEKRELEEETEQEASDSA